MAVRETRRSPFVIGVAGGSGSGKTTVLRRIIATATICGSRSDNNSVDVVSG